MTQGNLGDTSEKELEIIDRQDRTNKIGGWLSVLFLVVFSIIFFFIANSVNQEFNSWHSFSGRLYALIFLITCGIATIILHEASHGVFGLVFTRKLPKFGIKGVLPYTALPPNIQLQRNKGLVTSLAPLVVITICALAAMPFVSGLVTRGLFVLATFNASACSQDVLDARWLLRHDKAVFWGHDDDLVNVIYRRPLPTNNGQ
jgi:hypothetical protein